jgi:hypothetical protein
MCSLDRWLSGGYEPTHGLAINNWPAQQLAADQIASSSDRQFTR